MALRASRGDESIGLAASKCTMQTHPKRTPPQVFCLITENSNLRVANGCANTILSTTMDPRRPKEV
jgi:hypothetical protein